MRSPYKRLGYVLAASGVVMFSLTYALIDVSSHFYPNLNRGYMAVMMIAPMAVLMLIGMPSMYENGTLNIALYAGCIILFGVTFLLARTQSGIGDEQFLRSMIPHHSSAILMCEHASIEDPEIVSLCDDIVAAQKREIAIMKDLLENY